MASQQESVPRSQLLASVAGCWRSHQIPPTPVSALANLHLGDPGFQPDHADLGDQWDRLGGSCDGLTGDELTRCQAGQVGTGIGVALLNRWEA